MNKIIIIILSFLSLSIFFIGNNTVPVRGQSYSFDVDYMRADVTIKKDGSIDIEYWINFTCHDFAHAIDVVDIGFPNEHYDIDSVEASLIYNNHIYELDDIRVSTAIEIGVEIWLTPSIEEGESGQVYVKANNPKMVYQDWADQSLASVAFSPTWFSSDFCDEYKELEVNFIFPKGVKKEDAQWYYEENDKATYNNDNRLVYTWENENAPMKQYIFSASFPLEYVDSYIPWTQNPALVTFIVTILLIISISGLVIGTIFILYRYKKNYTTRYYPPKPRTAPGDKAGLICCFAFVGGFLLLMFWAIMGDVFLIGLFFMVFVVGFGMIGYMIYKIISQRMLKHPYAKPDIKIDCVGVNKKLTVVEAAVIQNTPLNKIIFLIIFSLVRTGHLKILGGEKELKFEVVSMKGVNKMRAYQKKFLSAVIKKPPKEGTIDEKKLNTLLIDLIKATYRKMSGYRLNATIRYYQNMIREAWDEVKKMPSDVEWEDIEKQYEWLVLDEKFETRSKDYFEDRYYYHRPYWYNHYYYHRYYYTNRNYHRYHGGSTAPPKEHINIFTFSDSIVRGMENISNNIVTGFSKFSNKIVEAVTPVKASSWSSGGGGGGGGGGCACACACAGCACACAGGGR